MPIRPRTLLTLLALVACDAQVTPPVEQASIAVSLREVELFATVGSATPDVETITISNNGSGSLAGLAVQGPTYIGQESGWLTTGLQDTTLQLTASAGGLDVGSYSAVVDVSLVSATNSPRSISVAFFVGESERIDLSQDSIRFTATEGGTVPPGQSVTISNGGEGTLSELEYEVAYPVGGEQDWLSTTLGSTTAPTSVGIVPQRVLPAGTHDAIVRVRSPLSVPGSDSVQVAFVVAPTPAVLISADELVIDAVEGSNQPIARLVAVDEKNRRTLTVAVEPGATWLSTTADTIVTPAELELIADPTGLPVGTQVGSIAVSSGSSDADTVVVNLVIRTMPTAEASAQRVEFTAYRTGPIPDPQIVSIENAGAYALSGLTLDVVPPSDWLTAFLNQTDAPAKLTLQVDPALGAPGTTVGTEVIVSGNAARADTVAVSFELLPGPSLAVSSDSVTFRAETGQALPQEQSLAVANDGEGSLAGLSVSASQTWLTASVTATTAPAEVVLRPNTTAVAVGTYTADLSILSPVADDSPRLVTVVYEVSAPGGAEPAEIVLSIDSVHFVGRASDSPLAPRELLIENGGSGALTDLFVEPMPAPWLRADLADSDAPTVLTLTPDLDATPVGTSDTSVTITSDVADSVLVSVVLTKQAGPEMVLTTSEVVFRVHQGQAPPDSQTITVSNASGGSLDAVKVIRNSVPRWLRASPTSASAAPTTVVLWLTTSATGSAPGTYTDTLQIESSTASNSPVELIVRLEVDPGPTIVASPRRLTMTGVLESAVPDTQVVTISNGGKGDLGTVLASSDSPWLSVSMDSSTSPPHVLVVADPTGGPVGSRAGKVTVGSLNAATTVEIPVTFDVVPPPEIALSPTVLVFHSTVGDTELPAPQTVSVFDATGRSLGDVTADSAAWLSTTVDIATVPASVVVQPNAVLDVLDSPYSATITVGSSAATNSPQQLTVVYYIDLGGRPVIRLSPDSLTFERGSPPAQTVFITNGGSGTLRDLKVVDLTGSDWLFVLLDSRVAPAKLTVAIDPARAAGAPANAVATLQISAEGAESKVVTVLLP